MNEEQRIEELEQIVIERDAEIKKLKGQIWKILQEVVEMVKSPGE